MKENKDINIKESSSGSDMRDSSAKNNDILGAKLFKFKK